MEKSGITNLRRRYSEFLGFELKVQKHRRTYKTISRVSRKSIKRLKREVKDRIKIIQKNPTIPNINEHNAFIRGIQNYYCKATLVNKDFAEIYYSCLPAMYNRFISFGKYEKPRSPPLAYRKLYRTTQKTFIIKGMPLYPICQIEWKKLSYFKPEINNYTPSGRLLLVRMQKPTIQTEIIKMGHLNLKNRSIEYSDNRLSKYSMQRGKCAVTKQFLTADTVHCHHIIPKKYGGSDSFNNLIIVHEWIHILIHATRKETIRTYLNMLKLNEKSLERLNKLRKNCNLAVIHY